MKIILIEDSPADQFIFTQIIERYFSDFSFKILSDGEEAINYIKNNNSEIPNIIFLDLNMPKYNGFEVLKEIKSTASFNPCKIFILSGSSYTKDVDQCIKLGANGYVNKPLTKTKMLEILERE